jgi:hypothetical protein
MSTPSFPHSLDLLEEVILRSSSGSSSLHFVFPYHAIHAYYDSWNYEIEGEGSEEGEGKEGEEGEEGGTKVFDDEDVQMGSRDDEGVEGEDGKEAEGGMDMEEGGGMGAEDLRVVGGGGLSYHDRLIMASRRLFSVFGIIRTCF